MSGHNVFVLVVSLLAIISAASATRKGNVIVGGYKPIKDLNDPYVQQVAKFAVDEHNKNAKEHLQLVRIVKGQSQVVAGTNYRLEIETNDSHRYQAIVYDKPWVHQRTLTSFTPL